MKISNTINAIAVLFVVLVVSTVGLSMAFQTPAHSHTANQQEHAEHEHDHHEHDHHNHGDAPASSAANGNGENLFNQGAQEYTCSMHPTFRSTDPNERCPICGMELIPVGAGGSSDDEFVRIEFSGRSLALLNLQVEPVQRGDAEHELRLTGQLEFDERGLTSISAWVGGRIEQLFVNYTGARVNANEPLAEIYSPSLLVAQQELLQAQRLAANEAPAFLRDSNQQTLRAARERLRLLGLSNAQIDEIITRGSASDRVTITAPSSGLVVNRLVQQGAYVNTGDTLLELANSEQMWAEFEVFERDVARFYVGQSLSFQLSSSQSSTAGAAAADLTGEVVSIAPRIDSDRRTRSVRVALQQSDGALVAGGFVRAVVRLTESDVLTIPTSAALITGKRAVVYVQTTAEGGEFEARTVELGERFGDRYAVLSGIEAGELIVSRGAFRIDSELQLRGRPSMMAPEGGGATGHEHHAPAGNGGDAPSGSDHSEHEQGSQASDAEHAGHTMNGAQQVNEHSSVQFHEELNLAPIFAAYHDMWNALQRDQLADWQAAAEQYFAAVAAVSWPNDLSEALELMQHGAGHAHHVSSIATARDQFYSHSQALIALAQAGYHSGELHLMFCPMARRGDGAFWLQQDEQLLNPYFGSRMRTCGDHEGVLTGRAQHAPEHQGGQH